MCSLVLVTQQTDRVVLRAEGEVSLHTWVSSGLSLAPLRVFFQTAGEGEAEDEEGAVTLGIHRHSAAAAATGKALPELPRHFPNRHLWLQLVPPVGFPRCPLLSMDLGCCARSLAVQGAAVPGAIPWECAHLASPSQEGVAGDPGWDGRRSWMWRWPQAGFGQGRIVLVTREFTPVSALVPFHGSTHGLGYFSSISFQGNQFSQCPSEV